MGFFIKIPEYLNEDKYFYSKDNENDIGIYKVGRYESGEKRHIYRTSVTTIEEARNLCERLNYGKMSEEELFKVTAKTKVETESLYDDFI